MVKPRGGSTKRPRAFESGYRLDSDLTVVGHLGGSRKVDVYLCRSKRLKRLAACKTLGRSYWTDFSALEAVMREGEILRRLDHPNVVRAFRVELQDNPRIVMEHLTGQTLGTTFFEGNYAAFEVGDAVNLVGQLADALSYVHGQGLLHLDVKPSNVMYDDGRATLFDFSVAKEYSPAHPLRDSSGTAEYMAPEQTHRRHVGYATDVFGLGVLVYRLLTGGVLPYPLEAGGRRGAERRSGRQLDYSHPPRPPSEINPAVPAAVASVAMKAIEPEIQRRYDAPSDFNLALVESQRSAGILR